MADGPPKLGPSPDSLQACGPFLRYQNADGDKWTGSVLFLTRDGADGAAAAAPVLTVEDASGGGSSAPAAPTKLDAELGWNFWRFELAFQLGSAQRAVNYSVEAAGGDGATHTFWLPAVGQPMHWGYYSCNGFSSNIKEGAAEREDPCYLWRDLLQQHADSPMHCLVGGGDQLYNDMVFNGDGSPALKTWGDNPDHEFKVKAAWTPEMEAESTKAYLNNYIATWVIPEVFNAFSSIPQAMVWDDHDIFDGAGSYDVDMQTCAVFDNLIKVARRFYLLFQHHTTDAFNATAQEFLINDGSDFHFAKNLGPQVVLLGVDMRSQRTKARILPQATYDLMDRTVQALPPSVRHVVVMCGCPLVFPSVPGAEAILGGVSWMVKTSPFFRKLFRKTGLLDRFDQPEILDDLVDGWAADCHKEERLQFIRLMQGFMEKKQLRVTILSGDAHVGGVGRLYSRPKKHDLADDPLYIPQIISSAIMNGPPGFSVVKMLLKTNWATNVDSRTRQKMVRTFFPKHVQTDKLINARNWCDVTVEDGAALKFSLRVEDISFRKGRAEETYDVVVPVHPAKKGAATTAAAPTVTAVPAEPSPLSMSAGAPTNGVALPEQVGAVLVAAQ